MSKSFRGSKSLLKELPLLTRSVKGESLYMYLGINDTVVSTVLFRKDELVDRPVFYVSKVLLDAETRYPLAEKIVLALVIALRKLRPYFQAHHIVVLTNQPL